MAKLQKCIEHQKDTCHFSFYILHYFPNKRAYFLIYLILFIFIDLQKLFNTFFIHVSKFEKKYAPYLVICLHQSSRVQIKNMYLNVCCDVLFWKNV